MQLRLQKCTIASLEVLVKISIKTFSDAFEADNDLEDFLVYINTAFSSSQLRKELENPNSLFYFVYLADDLAGYFKLNENDSQTDIKQIETIELERIYILEKFQGKKIGERVLQEVYKIAIVKKKSYVWLGVWEKNVKAIRFYKNHGFSKFGTHPYYIGKDKQTDWLMRYDLSTFNID